VPLPPLAMRHDGKPDYRLVARTHHPNGLQTTDALGGSPHLDPIYGLLANGVNQQVTLTKDDGLIVDYVLITNQGETP